MNIVFIVLFVFSYNSFGNDRLFECSQVGSEKKFSITQGAAGLDIAVVDETTNFYVSLTGLSCKFSNSKDELISCSQIGSETTFLLHKGETGWDFDGTQNRKIPRSSHYARTHHYGGLINCKFSSPDGIRKKSSKEERQGEASRAVN